MAEKDGNQNVVSRLLDCYSEFIIIKSTKHEEKAIMRLMKP